MAAPKGLESIYLVRHRGVHFNVVVPKGRKLPLVRNDGLSSRGSIKEARVSLDRSFSKKSIPKAQLPFPEDSCAAENKAHTSTGIDNHRAERQSCPAEGGEDLNILETTTVKELSL